MKFLLDAQLPPALKQVFLQHGYDCIHTLDLEKGNDTPDADINLISVNEQRIVVTKDSDFYDTFLLKQQPYKLILIKLGNLSGKELIRFFADSLPEIARKITESPILVVKAPV